MESAYKKSKIESLPLFYGSMLPTNDKIGICCRTKEDAFALAEIFQNNGLRWNGGEKFTSNNCRWAERNENTCYYLNYRNCSGIVFGNPDFRETDVAFYRFDREQPVPYIADISEFI